MEKFYSTVAKMQKKRMTTPELWASFSPQNRQEVQILVIFAVKSWEDQIFGARRRCHRTTDKDHAIPVKQGFLPCFFCLSTSPPSLLASLATASMRQSRPVRRYRWRYLTRGKADAPDGRMTWGEKSGRAVMPPLETGKGLRKTFPTQPGESGMTCLCPPVRR